MKLGKTPTSRKRREKWGTHLEPAQHSQIQPPTLSQRYRPPDHIGTCNLLEGLDGGSFVVFHVEDGVQLGDLKQIVDFLGEVQEFEFAALILGSGEGADQFADAGAIDIVNVLKVQNNLLVPLRQDIAHRVAENDAAFAEGGKPPCRPRISRGRA